MADPTRLYYADSYVTSFDARVVELGDDARRVYLDRTAFYPTSGGQPHDRGTLAGAAVIDVVDDGERVAHLLDAPLPAAVGDAVHGSVDWARRHDHMQQHTGQHLLSAVFADLFGWATVSVHFGDAYSTLDLDVEQLPPEALLACERRANEIVAESRPVTVSFEEAATAGGLRKASERAGVLRIVTIDGVDRSACGGTHVRATSEIGAVLLRRTERIRKQTRVEFVCGGRAIARARADYEALVAIAGSLSAAVDEAPALVAAQAVRLGESDSARRALERELFAFRARELHAATPPAADGTRRIRLRASSMDELRALAQPLADLERVIAVGIVDSPASLLLAASADSGLDAGKALKAAVTAVGGRGGGSPRVAQGTVPDAAALERIATALLTAAGAEAK